MACSPIEWALKSDAKGMDMERKRNAIKLLGIVALLAGAVLMACPVPGMAADAAEGQVAQTPEEDIQHLQEVTVKEKAGAPGLEQSPTKTVIDVERFTTIGPPTSVLDVLKTQAAIDFRGETDLDPGVDSIYLNGFDATRFVTAIDGLTVQKTGGRKSSNIVDYALLPTFMIEKMEILTGPHSAMYDSKSIGGVLNMMTARPERHDSLKPDACLTTSYGTYNTQNHELTVRGGVSAFTYDIAYRKYLTDGYLRNNETAIDTVFGRVGVVLPKDGFVAFSASYSEVDRQAPVLNPGQTMTDPDKVYSDYDADYPEVPKSPWSPLQNPTWDTTSSVYRLNAEQSTPIGRLSLGAYTSRDNRVRAYEEWIDSDDHTQGTYHTEMDTDWWQKGGKLQDEIQWTDRHITTVGFDMAKLYDDGVDDTKTERINKKGGYLQHQWQILPSVDLRLGLRYEDVKIYVTNNGRITGREDIIQRHWSQMMPKSFATWKMDGLASWLRDTALSAGISKIWRAPDYHGDYNPQGKPAGAWLDPEHGVGYDLVLDRRLWGDVALKLDYAFYDIKDYIVSNRSFAQFTPSPRDPDPDLAGLEYSDYKINLEEVHRHGVNLELGGHLTHDFSFYLTYAWQKFYNQGDEPAGEENLSKRAENRVGAGLRYDLFEKTTLMLDYAYQDDEVAEIFEEGDPRSDADDYFSEVQIDAYSVVDIGVQQKLFDRLGILQNGLLSFYIKNLLDEDYMNTEGYPATDRTVGVSFSVRM
jgi:outer membrane receptor protein involved in Fe transport